MIQRVVEERKREKESRTGLCYWRLEIVYTDEVGGRDDERMYECRWREEKKKKKRDCEIYERDVTRGKSD